MLRYQTPFSLQHKVIDTHLMIGLGSIFSCIAATTILTWHESLLNSLALVVGVSLATLLCGSFYLRKSLRTDFSIERQLTRIAHSPADSDWEIETVRCADRTTDGWNRLADKLDSLRRNESVMERLEAIVAKSHDGRWTDLFDAMPQVLIVSNAEGVVRYANQALAVACGWSDPSPALGKTVGDLLTEIVGDAALTHLEEFALLAVGESMEICRSENLAEGVWRIARLSAVDPLNQSSAMWQISDVTQKCVVQAARDQFVFAATHELRTPLANIRAYAETLAMADDIDVRAQKSFINTINAEASRLARFIDDLLNISQMEAGAISVERHETDLEKMLLEVVENVRSLVEKKRQDIEVKLPVKLSKLWIDKDKIASAVTNLLSNANKYTTDEGQIRLLVEEDEAHLHIHVEDSGIGIAADELPRISEKFFRSQDPRVREVTGSGIGLAFSHEVARLHGGRLSILSEIDKGSRFTLTLPLSLRQR